MKAAKETLSTAHFALPASQPGLWVGVYQHRDLGVRRVRSGRAVKMFATEEEADKAADDALCKALDEMPALRATREIIVTRKMTRRW